jgi:transposase-like protein
MRSVCDSCRVYNTINHVIRYEGSFHNVKYLCPDCNNARLLDAVRVTRAKRSFRPQPNTPHNRRAA